MIIDKLTDLYYFIKKANGDPSSLLEKEYFLSYITNCSTKDFCEAVFCYGMELRDFEDYSNVLIQFINILNVEFEKRKEEILANPNLHSMYNIGLANLRFYFCKRTGFNITSLQLEEEDFSDDSQFNVELSVLYLRESLRLLSAIINKAQGLMFYQAIKSLDYAWNILDNYRVNNGDIPIDLDSAYVFLDQLDNDEIWIELIKQMKSKYNLK